MKPTITKKIRSFVLVIIGMFSLSFVCAQSPRDVQTINPVIGDVSFVEKFGHKPDAATCEDLRIQTHLAYAENLLRQKDVSDLSPEMQQKRTHMLDLLHDYWTRGKFPRNYDYKDTRKPCFIDKDGTICAVGYLVEQTSGREAAEAINGKFKYAFVKEMNDALVDNWIASSGLTKEECATIQPDYGGGWYSCYCANQPKNNAYCYQKANGSWGCRHYNYRMGQQAVSSDDVAIDNVSPNPVTSAAVISFYIPKAEKVSMNLFDIGGKWVATLTDDNYEAGDHDITLNTEPLSTGIYFVRMEAGDEMQVEKISIIK